MTKTARETSADSPVTVAVFKIMEHFGAANCKVFRAPDGEVIVESRDVDHGLTLTRIIDAGNNDGWVAILHVKPKNLEAGLPRDFNTTFMFDTAKDWWPAKPGEGN